ncbi:murein biosynthesis integral membrane protein MurJ [Cognatishimia sp. SS12]|uniref:murein biosynthesis integral membrane protein MurJ n=1 Tax=Cognatishimia sp. SS12 TaxID=2979465 RepID=UPI00232C214D|nr:murein biosynthesis integral membrane protein MurJ [Cognatishimia sp. SS12]MDC0739019.1 murein biosynthesis integral membrane protein MurJ [Cognatishimia sp. SS12]
MKPIRLIRGFLTVGFWTLLSRVLGFAREILILSLIGPGAGLDAFVAAFRLPNMFRRFFAEGAFNAAFVPLFSKKYEAGEDARAFAQNALSGLALAVMVLTALAMIFMPGLVWLTAEGFYGDPRFDVTVGYGRIVFPYIFFMSLAALFSGVLNATGRFAVAAAAPVLLNVFTVAAMTLAYFLGQEVIRWLVWVIPVAGVAQLALVWVAADRAGVRLRPARPRWTNDMALMLKVALPAALASGVMQINLVVGQLVASRTEGAISWLFAADRLYQLPLGVVGIAVGIVLLPDLSRRLKAGDDSGAQQAFSRASEFALALSIPSAIAFLVVPLPLVSVMYERGATTASDAQAIAWAVAVYGLGLPAFILQKLYQPLFFAREDTKSPFRYALWAMAINAGLSFGLHPLVGWLAPAIAATVAGWAMVAMLALGARQFGVAAQLDTRFKTRIWRICLAALIMGAALLALFLGFRAAFFAPGLRYLALTCLVLIGGVVYFGAGQILGAFKLSEIKRAGRSAP